MAREPVTPSDIFGERVREIRDRRGWTQEDLAIRILNLEGQPVMTAPLNARRVTVARVEGGDRGIGIDDVFLFAAALGVSPLNLMLDNDANRPVTLAARLTLPTSLITLWLEGELPIRGDDVSDSVSNRDQSVWRRWFNLSPFQLPDEALAAPEVREAVGAFIDMERRRVSDQRLSLRRPTPSGLEPSAEAVQARQQANDEVEHALNELQARLEQAEEAHHGNR